MFEIVAAFKEIDDLDSFANVLYQNSNNLFFHSGHGSSSLLDSPVSGDCDTI